MIYLPCSLYGQVKNNFFHQTFIKELFAYHLLFIKIENKILLVKISPGKIICFSH